MTATTEQRAQAMIDALGNKKSGYTWLAHCNSPTAFIKTWSLGRAGRRQALLAALNKKTVAKGAARGYVIVRHALIALENLARSAKSKGGQMIVGFMHFVMILGLWAARAVAHVVDVPLRRYSRLNPGQQEFPFDIFSA